MINTITHNEVEYIANELSSTYTLVNMGSYYIINDIMKDETTSYTYHSNFVYLDFSRRVRGIYLTLIMKDMSYFSWRVHGFNIAKQREDYLTKVTLRVIEILCGFKQINYEPRAGK